MYIKYKLMSCSMSMDTLQVVYALSKELYYVHMSIAVYKRCAFSACALVYKYPRITRHR